MASEPAAPGLSFISNHQIMKNYILLAACLTVAGQLYAQSAMDGYALSQPDMKGTARFMSMGGAFGALGGDLSTLSQNPAGIGIYRSQEIGFTLNLDCQHSQSDALGMKTSDNQTKFLLNNLGGVATLRLGSSTLPNFNFGFTYNKAASFNRRFTGTFANLSNSMSNYIAGVSNNSQVTEENVESTTNFDPYLDDINGFYAPWISILGYDSYLISPTGDPQSPQWVGQWGNGTSGFGQFGVEEKGHVDEYNISLGGNISNIVFWGMDFGIIDLDYSLSSYWGETLTDAYVYGDNNSFAKTAAKWTLSNYYKASGNGFNYKLGVIVKPIQELRIGFAFHTPTWYNISETYMAQVNFNYGPGVDTRGTQATTNNGVPGSNEYNFRTPWRFIASLAGVIGNRFIISADYEWTSYNHMRFSERGYDYYDDYYYPEPYSYDAGPYSDAYYLTNKDVKDYYQTSSTIRVGAEFRVTPKFSVRAGYSYVSSPVRSAARDNQLDIYTSGTNPSYRFDNSTNYVTCGLGYRVQKFYVDLAYVYKHTSSDYHVYTPDPRSGITSPQAKISFDNSQIVLSAGFRF